jgi:glycosyltransferase involved in cell wall biosynthesis
LLGRPGTGGAGTADSLLAVALARHGYDVELLIASGREIEGLNERWTRTYESFDVDVQVLKRQPGLRPAYLAPSVEVFHALRADPPDLAIVNDWRALGWAALRAREAALALTNTAFVVHCHGPARVLSAFAQKVPDTLERFGEEKAERASLELADGVVSPSAWLLQWMREHEWPVPDSAIVIPNLWEAVALGEAPSHTTDAGDERIRRLAFFGQLREGKGIRIFLDALDRLEDEVIDGVDLLFLGSASKRWSAARLDEALRSRAGLHVGSVRIETQLERESALRELRQPGTLAVMPSLLDNSPNAVLECLELGIPFVATATGGIPELVAQEDRARVLCAPNAADLAHALARALDPDASFSAARPAEDPQAALAAWLALVESVTPADREPSRPPRQVAFVTTGEKAATSARRVADRGASAEVEVVQADSRRAGLASTTAEWIIFLDDEDDPHDEMLETLVAAQAATGADVVTAAVRPAGETDGVRMFLGNPGALGLLENQYGVVGLVRASLAEAELSADDGVDRDWNLLARIALGGGRIVSVPEPLFTHSGRPGRIGDIPGDALTVLETFEERGGANVSDLAQLAATLAASLRRETSDAKAATGAETHSVLSRARARLRAG